MLANTLTLLFLHAGIESIFPNESYFAWYQQPTRDALQAAHSRVAEQLCPTLVEGLKPNGGRVGAITTNIERNNLGVFTPPETPTSFTPGLSPTRMHKPLTTNIGSSGAVAMKSCQVARVGIEQRIQGIDTPLSYPSTAGVRTPMDSQLGRYDGMICFSQGCAVSTGLLLEMGAKPPIRFVILICGGRPFDAKGTMERVVTTSATPIKVPSIHIHGRPRCGSGRVTEAGRLVQRQGQAGDRARHWTLSATTHSGHQGGCGCDSERHLGARLKRCKRGKRACWSSNVRTIPNRG